MTRQEIQQEAIELALNNDTVILQWATGLGKSRAAINIMNTLCEQDLDKRLNVLFVIAEVAHKENWYKEFAKFGIAVCNMVVVCYASLKRYKNTKWDLVILDECHHIGSDIRVDILSNMSIDKLVCLSATIPQETFMTIGTLRKDSGYNKLAMSRITLKDAIECGILPEPKVFLIPLLLDNINQDCIIVEEWGKSAQRVTIKCKLHERWQYLTNKSKYPNVKLEISCTQQQKYDYLTEQFEYWKLQFFRTRQERTKNKWLQTGAKRKRFLGECKTLSAEILLNKLSNKRFICFCSSIEQSESLGGSNCIHSKKKDSLSIIDSFNKKEIDNLFAVGMLQEGQNLTDIEVGVIIQLDGQERAFIQKFGRSLRAQDPIQFIFYYRGTKDMDYLKNVLEGVNEEYITEVDNLLDLEV